ncbi:hypothetical protein IAQ61_007015 [Plenodomus lingam]|uniref:uncharacterized protein n=1 Tax=Leptosphaeria maculans TaxID=5022 RepID=UPI00331A1F8B|nr:hypothetical protein IAQ61_007015 [Plenodomus lingam]
MAAPNRPNVVQQGGATVYESLDEVDENLYNQIQRVYQRAAFLDVIIKWRKDMAQGKAGPFETGHDIQDLWQRRMDYWSKKRKSKPMLPRPQEVATPPLPSEPAISPQPGPQNISTQVGTQTSPQQGPRTTSTQAGTQTTSTQAGLRTNMPQPGPQTTPIRPVGPRVPTAAPPGTPSSGELSPPFRADRPDEEPLAPTHGQLKHMYRSEDGPWTFARIIASSRRGDRGTPWKANWLLVRVSPTNNIEEQIVAKWVGPYPGYEAEAEDEIRINELLRPAQCTHILPLRGHSKRLKRKRIIEGTDINEMEMTEYFMYSDFAPLGTLRNIPESHDSLLPGPDGRKKIVSEHFIWYVLGELAKGLLVLKTGQCLPSNKPFEPAEPPEDSTWAPILHNDIKDINIMIVEGNDKYPTYPRVLLFDFGLSRVKESDREHEALDGTIIWTSPERRFVENPAQDYIPSKWPCSERSDIWSVGLIAWQLMQATQGVDAFDQYLIRRTKEFSTDPRLVREGACNPQDSLFPSDLESSEIPTEYSVELCRFVQSCLRYHPAGRPDVDTVLQTAQERLTSLDRLHRDEFSNTGENILHDFRPEYGLDDRNAAYAIGQQFTRPVKKRRTAAAQVDRTTYDDLINQWADKDRYPRPSPEDAFVVMQGIRDYINSIPMKDKDYAAGYVSYQDTTDPHPLTLAWRHLYSKICKEIDPSHPVYVSNDKRVRDHDHAFADQNKYICLSDAIRYFLSFLWGEGPNDTSNPWYDLQSTGEALEHACRWGMQLIKMQGEPAPPRLEDGSIFHRAIGAWILEPEPGIDLSKLQNDQGGLINVEASSDDSISLGQSDDEDFDEGGQEEDDELDDENGSGFEDENSGLGEDGSELEDDEIGF